VVGVEVKHSAAVLYAAGQLDALCGAAGKHVFKEVGYACGFWGFLV